MSFAPRSLARSVTLAAACAAGLAWAAPLAAETQDSASFNVYVRGFKFGTVSYSAVEQDQNYAVSAVVEATGLIGALVNARYDARASGRIVNGRYVPQRYNETAQRGDRRTVSRIDYRNGVPQAKVQDPPMNPRPSDVNPASQGGTADPATAIYIALREVTREEACRLDRAMFDGRYRAQVKLTNPRPNGDGLVCSGSYTRAAGYTPEEMEGGASFPFTAYLSPTGRGAFQVQRLEMSTIYGPARVERR